MYNAVLANYKEYLENPEHVEFLENNINDVFTKENEQLVLKKLNSSSASDLQLCNEILFMMAQCYTDYAFILANTPEAASQATAYLSKAINYHDKIVKHLAKIPPSALNRDEYTPLMLQSGKAQFYLHQDKFNKAKLNLDIFLAGNNHLQRGSRIATEIISACNTFEKLLKDRYHDARYQAERGLDSTAALQQIAHTRKFVMELLAKNAEKNPSSSSNIAKPPAEHVSKTLENNVRTENTTTKKRTNHEALQTTSANKKQAVVSDTSKTIPKQTELHSSPEKPTRSRAFELSALLNPAPTNKVIRDKETINKNRPSTKQGPALLKTQVSSSRINTSTNSLDILAQVATNNFAFFTAPSTSPNFEMELDSAETTAHQESGQTNTQNFSLTTEPEVILPSMEHIRDAESCYALLDKYVSLFEKDHVDLSQETMGKLLLKAAAMLFEKSTALKEKQDSPVLHFSIKLIQQAISKMSLQEISHYRYNFSNKNAKFLSLFSDAQTHTPYLFERMQGKVNRASNLPSLRNKDTKEMMVCIFATLNQLCAPEDYKQIKAYCMEKLNQKLQKELPSPQYNPYY